MKFLPEVHLAASGELAARLHQQRRGVTGSGGAAEPNPSRSCDHTPTAYSKRTNGRRCCSRRTETQWEHGGGNDNLLGPMASINQRNDAASLNTGRRAPENSPEKITVSVIRRGNVVISQMMACFF